jgi:HKD family nuclease
MKSCRPVHPDKNALSVIAKNGVSLNIYSPFYTASGLLLLSNIIKDSGSLKQVNFNCRLRKADWIQGSIDPIALVRLTKTFSGKIRFSFSCDDSLHAKAYYCEKKGLIGSANLTSQGFGNRLEFLLLISGTILGTTKKWFSKHIHPYLKRFSQKELAQFIRRNEAEVKKEKEKLKKLKAARSKQRGVKTTYSPIDEFMDYCAGLPGPAAKEVVLRYMGKDQLSGHIRNFYYASQQFLSKYIGLTTRIARKSAQTFRLQEMPFKDQWISFIHSSDLKNIPDANYSAQSTIRYLPESLGGKQTTGGAGIGNLNRVLPLVAKYRKSGGY